VEGSAVVTGNTQVISRAKVRGGSKVHNAIICQASLIEGFDVIDSDYYCQTEDPEPAHPGELGKKTLLGVDSDRDGVRDDVEIWINERFSNSSDKDMFNYRMAFKQMAAAKTKIFKFKDVKAKVIEADSEVFDALNCLEGIYVNKSQESKKWIAAQNELIDYVKDLDIAFINTKERIQAELKTREFSHGEILKAGNKTKSGCYFGVRK
jgi:hypothetical protein